MVLAHKKEKMSKFILVTFVAASSVKAESNGTATTAQTAAASEFSGIAQSAAVVSAYSFSDELVSAEQLQLAELPDQLKNNSKILQRKYLGTERETTETFWPTICKTQMF